MSERGFTLVELVVVIIIIGILAGVGIQKMNQQSDIQKAQATVSEMETILHVISGDPNLYSNGRRTDFGYIGTHGSIPSTLNALGDSELLTDAWGDAYTWDPVALTLTSQGNGTPVVKTLYSTGTLTPGDYVNNTVNGIVLDSDGIIPPNPDSVTVAIYYQSGGSDSTVAGASGQFTFTGAPIGNHTVKGYYQSQVVPRFLSVIPEVSSYGCEIVFSSW